MSSTFCPLSEKSRILRSASSVRATLSPRTLRRRISSRTLPSLRVRRALIPCLSHASSLASFLSNSASLRSRAARSSSRLIRNLSKPQSKAISLPLSTSTTFDDKLRRKVLSCETNTIVFPQPFKNFSSHTTESMSRWLVGSSSSRMSGFAMTPRASSARRFSPAEAVEMSSVGSSSSLSAVSRIRTSAVQMSESENSADSASAETLRRAAQRPSSPRPSAMTE